MKKWTFCFSRCLICCLGSILALQLSAAQTTSNTPNLANTERLKTIDLEIEKLDKKLHEYRLKEMNKEIESQPLMFEQWHEYSDKLEQAENYEDTVHKLENQRQELIRERDKLLPETK